tara:strand:+ start:693 stop:887 length:195 start_codon:yes stop_codon:yes gene_type:complete
LERDRFQSGQTALAAAANSGKPQIVEMLLKAGARDASARDYASNFNRQNREAKEACIMLIDRYS